MAELSLAEKNAISHRGAALRDLRDKLAGESGMRGRWIVVVLVAALACGALLTACAPSKEQIAAEQRDQCFANQLKIKVAIDAVNADTGVYPDLNDVIGKLDVECPRRYVDFDPMPKPVPSSRRAQEVARGSAEASALPACMAADRQSARAHRPQPHPFGPEVSRGAAGRAKEGIDLARWDAPYVWSTRFFSAGETSAKPLRW